MPVVISNKTTTSNSKDRSFPRHVTESSSRKVPDLRNIRLTVYVDRLYCLVDSLSVLTFCIVWLTVYVDVLYFGNVMPGSKKFEISIPFAFSTRKDLQKKAQYR